MGIKDKVLDILFDDDEQESSYNNETTVSEKKNYEASSFLDTGSVFIDATSPLPKTNVVNKKPVEEPVTQDTKPSSEYQFAENISPIFGVIDSKNKKSKNISKMKSFNDLNTNKTDSTNKNQSQGYTSVVISPIFGPISTKPVKKNSKPRKKVNDPFERDITDTGSFDAIIDEKELEQPAPDFEEAKEEIVEQVETSGDTDRLIRISDKINKIKNEAAIIYDETESDDESIIEDGYQVETIEHKNISDLIHSVQNYDGKINHNLQPNVEETIDENIDNEPSFEPKEEEVVKEELIEESSNDDSSYEEETSVSNNINIEPTINTSPDSQASIDDLFQDEDDTEEGKDLFSVLFGDE